MSEQSNKPSPSPARAATSERNPASPRAEKGQGETRAPLTRTNELQARPERPHREAGERGGERRGSGQGSPRGQVREGALASARAEARVKPPAAPAAPQNGERQARKPGEGERRPR